MIFVVIIALIAFIICFGILGSAVLGLLAIAAWIVWSLLPIAFGIACFLFMAIGRLFRPDIFDDPCEAFMEGFRGETARRRASGWK